MSPLSLTSFAGSVVGGPCGEHGTMCTVSFPPLAECKRAWDRLARESDADRLSTACVFLASADQGTHILDPDAKEIGDCYCSVLYGRAQPWGCERFARWRQMVEAAHERGQTILVFYKVGWLKRHGAEGTSWPLCQTVEGEVAWDDLARHGYEGLRAMGGLGALQKGEVAWLKKQGIPFLRMDVAAGAPTVTEAAQMLVRRVRALSLDRESSRREAQLLAEKLRMMGNLDQAMDIHRALVAAVQTSAPPTHPDTLAAKQSLAALLIDKGEVAEALELCREVAVGYTMTLGERDLATLTAKGKLAILQAQLGEHTLAKALYQEVISGLTDIMGDSHPGTLNAKAGLAGLLAQVGEEADARAMYQEAIKGLAAALGDDHVDTLRAKEHLASLLTQMGIRAEALALYRFVVDGYTRRVGPNHPLSLEAKDNLAVLLEQLGEQARAQALYEQVVEGFTQTSGASHDSTLKAKMNLGNLLMELGQRAAARALYEVVVEEYSMQLGPGPSMPARLPGTGLSSARSLAVRLYRYIPAKSKTPALVCRTNALALSPQATQPRQTHRLC